MVHRRDSVDETEEHKSSYKSRFGEIIHQSPLSVVLPLASLSVVLVIKSQLSSENIRWKFPEIINS